MMRHPIATATLLCLAGGLAWTLSRPDEIPFEKHALDLGSNEACAVADVNGDGKPDIISGENWYEGPRWIKHKFRAINFANNYIDDFSDLPLDVNGVRTAVSGTAEAGNFFVVTSPYLIEGLSSRLQGRRSSP